MTFDAHGFDLADITDECPDAINGEHQMGDNSRCQFCDQPMEDPRW